MKRELLLKKAHTLLNTYSDMGPAEIEAELAKLEQQSESLDFDSSMQMHTIDRLCALHCAENFALYTALFIYTNSSLSDFFYGDEGIHLAVKQAVDKDFSGQETTVDYKGKSITVHVYTIKKDGTVFQSVSYSNSPYFSDDYMHQFTEKSTALLRAAGITSYDFYDDTRYLREWFSGQDKEITVLYYHFKNFYEIFKHLGIDQVESINSYIHDRLGVKYTESVQIYQLSMEIFLVLFTQDIKDLKIVFSYNNIPIPYTVKKILIKGADKYTKLMDYINQ